MLLLVVQKWLQSTRCSSLMVSETCRKEHKTQQFHMLTILLEVSMDAKISVNKLGEYMDASASRRKQILRDQKAPLAFKVARYREARETIVQHMEQGMTDDSFAMQRVEVLRNDHSGSDFTAQDRQLSADAIEDFLPLAEEIG